MIYIKILIAMFVIFLSHEAVAMKMNEAKLAGA